MNNENISKLTNAQISEIKKYFEPQKYLSSAHIIYKGQVPFIGLVLIDGNMKLVSKKNEMELDLGSIVGLKELINSEPFHSDIFIDIDSIVLPLDKSSIIEILENDEASPKIKDVLQSVLAS